MYRPVYECYCPFYQGEYKKCICCDGIGESTKTIKEFDTEKAKINYISKHCIQEMPNDCEIFCVLAEKYGAD